MALKALALMHKNSGEDQMEKISGDQGSRKESDVT